MGEKSHKKMYLSKGFCLKFLLKIHNSLSVLVEWDIFSHDFLSQNCPCIHAGSDGTDRILTIILVFMPCA